MIKKLLFTLLTLVTFYTSASLGCEMKIFTKIYVADEAKDNNWSELIESSTCEKSVETRVLRFITNAKGTIRTSVIPRELGIANLSISPTKVVVNSLSTSFKRSSSLAESYLISSLSLVDGKKFLGLNELDQLRFLCSKCQKLGESPLQLKLERTSGTQTLWAKAMITQETIAYFPQRHIGANQKYLEASDFEAKKISVKNPGEIFTKIEDIGFYMTVRALNPEEPLKQIDLYAQNLVSPQNLADITFKTGRLFIETKGYPVRAARLGEIINIRNSQSNRLIQAKVVGRNKVVVE